MHLRRGVTNLVCILHRHSCTHTRIITWNVPAHGHRQPYVVRALHDLPSALPPAHGLRFVRLPTFARGCRARSRMPRCPSACHVSRPYQRTTRLTIAGNAQVHAGNAHLSEKSVKIYCERVVPSSSSASSSSTTSSTTIRIRSSPFFACKKKSVSCAACHGTLQSQRCLCTDLVNRHYFGE